ncbi:MAG: hypothetical protein LC808_32240, partial [Actinobacteria bacterium]|nr:hypothetical protein [Actinomycetota bacterium]
VSQVKWFVDDAEVAWDGDGAPWTKSWDSATVADGSHRMIAKAADAAGNWGNLHRHLVHCEQRTPGGPRSGCGGGG